MVVRNPEERRRLKRIDVNNTLNKAHQNMDSHTKETIKTLLTRLDNLRLDLKDLDSNIFDDRVDNGMNQEDSEAEYQGCVCLLYTSPSPRDKRQSRMPSSA